MAPPEEVILECQPSKSSRQASARENNLIWERLLVYTARCPNKLNATTHNSPGLHRNGQVDCKHVAETARAYINVQYLS